MDFDILPILKNGNIESFVNRTKMISEFRDNPTKFLGKNVSDIAAEIKPEFIMSSKASISEFIQSDREDGWYFILRGRKIDGIVTTADLQKLPVRTLIASLIIHVEILMTEFIKKFYKDENEWFIGLRLQRQKRIEGNWKKLREDDLTVDRITVSFFCDKRDGILNKFNFHSFSKGTAKSELINVEKLRNSVFHANNYTASIESTKSSIEAAKLALAWIDRLQDKLQDGLEKESREQLF